MLLVAALVAALLGTLLVWMYAHRTQQAALAGQEPVQVLVATADIETNTAASSILPSGRATLVSRARADVPADAMHDLESVGSMVTVTKILAGQVFQPGMFGAPGTSETTLNVPADHLAVSLALGDPQQVAGFVTPGSRVAVFLTASGVGDESATQTTLLLENAEVLAVGARTSGSTGQSGDQAPSSLLTLALTQKDAQRVIQAQNVGQLYLGLVGVNSADALDRSADGTTSKSLLD